MGTWGSTSHQSQAKMSSSARLLSFLLAIYCAVSLAQAKSYQSRKWNVCASAETRCRSQCLSLAPTATCSGSCGLFQTKTWTCHQLVRNGGGGHTPMLGYTGIKEQGN